MAKKKIKSTETQPSTELVSVPRRARKAAVMPPEIAQEMATVKAEAESAKTRLKTVMKEGRALAKVVTMIESLNEWALDQVPTAIERRRAVLKGDVAF